MARVPTRNARLLLFAHLVELSLLPILLVTAGWTLLHQIVSLVELCDLAAEFLVLSVDSFLQGCLVIFLSILGIDEALRIQNAIRFHPLAAALIPVVAHRRA